jgi:DNA-binding NtrC family response regulator
MNQINSKTGGEMQEDHRNCLVLVVDDREDNRSTMAEVCRREGYAVMTAKGGQEAMGIIGKHSPDLVLADLQMPDTDGIEVLKTARAANNPPEVILLTAYGTVETAVDALKHGAFNYLTKPINLKNLRAQINKALEHRNMDREVRVLRRRVEVQQTKVSGQGVVIESKSMKDLMKLVEKLGERQSTVLIGGESGVGKEVVAQALHQAMPDAPNRPFIAVHCAALPESLLESELFGCERGAFTGAEKQTLGRLELADRGTLFLDEIGEIPLSMQVKLLRVLEQKELTRVGGRDVIKVDFRLIAATNRQLEDMVQAGEFREDLYYRLNVIRLEVPPLRQRNEDIIPVFDHFLRRFASDQGVPSPRVTPEVADVLNTYSWPGNVRELRNLAERVSIFTSGREISISDLPPNMVSEDAGQHALDSDLLDLHKIERITIEKAVEQYGGNLTAASGALGISRRTLQRKLKEYRGGEARESGIDPDSMLE